MEIGEEYVNLVHHKLSNSNVKYLQFSSGVGHLTRFSSGMWVSGLRLLSHLHEIARVADRNYLNCGVQVCPQRSVMLPVCN